MGAAKRTSSSATTSSRRIASAPSSAGSTGALRGLAADAGRRLGAAGIEAWKRGETPATVNLLGRATELLPEQDAFRLELLCELGIALRTGGQLSRAEATLVGVAEAAATAGDRRLELRARLELAYVSLFSDPRGSTGDLLDVAAEAVPVFEAVEDDRSLGRAWLALAFAHGSMLKMHRQSGDGAEHALTHYSRSGWPASTCLGLIAAALYYGPTPVVEAIRRCRKLLETAELGGEANVSAVLGGLEAMRGRFGEARRLVSKARSSYEELGQVSVAEANCGTIAAGIELLSGDAKAAVRLLRASCEVLELTGDRAYLATRAAELADALCLETCDDEAERWITIAEAVRQRWTTYPHSSWLDVFGRSSSRGEANSPRPRYWHVRPWP